jgi:hypothetical protein
MIRAWYKRAAAYFALPPAKIARRRPKNDRNHGKKRTAKPNKSKKEVTKEGKAKTYPAIP